MLWAEAAEVQQHDLLTFDPTDPVSSSFISFVIYDVCLFSSSCLSTLSYFPFTSSFNPHISLVLLKVSSREFFLPLLLD